MKLTFFDTRKAWHWQNVLHGPRKGHVLAGHFGVSHSAFGEIHLTEVDRKI
jgi:hypothetical protein